MEDFSSSMETHGSGGVGGEGVVAEAKVSGNVDTVDGLSPVSIMKKKADIKTVRSKFSGRYVKYCVYCMFMHLKIF